jgi:disulfide bond formation protein DsbB
VIDRVSVRGVFGACIVVPLAAVCIALYTQVQLGMHPCPWCTLQRAIFVSIALCALPGLLSRTTWARVLSAVPMLLLAAGGVSAALWQHFVAASSTSCNLTLADRIVRGAGLDELWPLVFSATATCAEAAANLLGVPYEFYSLTLFVGLGAAAVWVLFQPRR